LDGAWPRTYERGIDTRIPYTVDADGSSPTKRQDLLAAA